MISFLFVALAITSMLIVGCSQKLPNGPETTEDVKSKFDGKLRKSRSHHSVTITNGLPTTDPNFFSATIGDGGAVEDLVKDGSDQLFELLGYLDLSSLGLGVLNFMNEGTAAVLEDDTVAPYFFYRHAEAEAKGFAVLCGGGPGLEENRGRKEGGEEE